MNYCKRMNRSCSCDRLVTYDASGQITGNDNGPGCLTDNEVRGMLTVLLREWRRRCSDAEMDLAASLAQWH